jgi:hypothetical protein
VRLRNFQIIRRSTKTLTLPSTYNDFPAISDLNCIERFAVHVLPQDQIDLYTLASPKISHVCEYRWGKNKYPISRQNQSCHDKISHQRLIPMHIIINVFSFHSPSDGLLAI